VLAHGVRGYIPSSVDLNLAIEAIRLAQAGGIFVPVNCLVQSLRQEHTQSETSGDPLSDLFTRQQAAVANALRRGKANKIIAYEMNLAESTVKVHIRNIMRKVQARNRTEVAFKISSYLGQSSTPGVGSGAPMR
jgi:DNA-binding NarL/FixJ family response regulator